MNNILNDAVVRVVFVFAFLLTCAVASANAQVTRQRNVPVQSPSPPGSSRVETRPRGDQVTTTPGNDSGIIIVGGRGNTDVRQPEINTGPLGTRDEAPPKIVPNPNPVSFAVYIPKGQNDRTVDVSWDDGPNHEYCEIFLSINGGEQYEFGRFEQGTKPLAVKLGEKYDFKMVVYSDDQGGNPTTIANMTIKGELQPQPPAGGGGAAASDRVRTRVGTTRNNAIEFFLNPKVKPQPDSAVTFSFQTAEPSEFFVEVSKRRPDPNAPSRVSSGQPLGAAFPPGTQLEAFTLPGLSGVKTKHEVTLRGAGGKVLEANTTYHYVITAKAPNGTFWRYGGSFSMAGRDIKVVWEKIKIINDSDDVGCGEVDLWFWANHGQPGGKYLGIGRFNNDVACTDHVYELGKEMIIEDALDVLSLSVSAMDDDDNLGFWDVRLGAKVKEPKKEAHDYGVGEWNVAAKDFNITGFEVGASIPFHLVSLPAFGQHEEGDLMFEVWGRIEILAPR